MNNYNLLKAVLFASLMAAPTLYAQDNSSADDVASTQTEKQEGLVVYEIKSQNYVESTVVRRGEGKLTDYYDQSRKDQAIFSDGEIGSLSPLRAWKLN